jgi:hypothetical protein
MFLHRPAGLPPERTGVAGERISGPLRRHFFASYALVCCGGFVGYSKICRKPPRDVWECEAIFKVGVDVVDSADEAMRRAELRAQAWLDFLTAAPTEGRHAASERDTNRGHQ